MERAGMLAGTPVSNGHNGAILKLFPDGLLNKGISLNIYIRCCLVQDQYLQRNINHGIRDNSIAAHTKSADAKNGVCL